MDNVLIVDGNFWAPPQVEYLRLTNASLTQISPPIAALEHLKELDVSHNRITSLPRLQSVGLQKLYVGSQKIATQERIMMIRNLEPNRFGMMLPDSIQQFSKLNYLYVDQGSIVSNLLTCTKER